MTALVFGVIDLPYAVPPASKHVDDKATAASKTTGEVAGYLEDKYHIMRIFYEQNAEQIGEMFAEAAVQGFENAMLGAPPAANPYLGVTSAIDQNFRAFLDNDSLANLGFPGVPTKAALAGFNPRLKVKKGSPRPSFIATGLYQSAFRSWVD